MATVGFQNVQKVFRDSSEVVVAIEDFSLEVKDGEFAVIVGQSGCGKTTLLRLIAGLDAPTHGTILIDGSPANALEPAERNVAMVFQNFALYPHMTVYENLAFGLKSRGLKRVEVEQRIIDVVKILELDDLLNRLPSRLSGGQRQRVAVGRAIVQKPRVFLFDEPLSNLDPELRSRMRLELRRLQRFVATTAIYVTHDQTEAMTMADTLVVMRKGRIEQVGTPMEIYARPRSKFVAGFIGSPPMNFFEGEIRGNAVFLGEQRLSDLSSEKENSGERTKVVVGARPEHIRIVDSSNSSAVSLDIDTVDSLGSEVIIYGRTGQSKDVVAIRTSGLRGFTLGQRIWAQLDPRHLHLFDRKTESRLDISV